jgi:hypothetical protein
MIRKQGISAVLFLFVVMMFHIQIAEIHEEVLRYLPVSGLISHRSGRREERPIPHFKVQSLEGSSPTLSKQDSKFSKVNLFDRIKNKPLKWRIYFQLHALQLSHLAAAAARIQLSRLFQGRPSSMLSFFQDLLSKDFSSKRRNREKAAFSEQLLYL